MGLCRSLERPCEPARATSGKRLWSCDAPSCDQRRVPWGPSWQWYGSYRDLEDSPFSVFAVCSEACREEFDAARAPKVLEPING